MYPLDFVSLSSFQDDFAALVDRVPDASSTVLALEFHNYHATLGLSQKETAFPNRGTMSNVAIIPTWTKQENDEACKEWCIEMQRKFSDELERRKLPDDVDETTRSGAYGGEYTNYDGKSSPYMS